MSVPSRVSMFVRMVGGNAADPYPGALDPAPENDESKISAHTFIAVLQMWANGEITKADLVAQYNFTHAEDSDDLDSIKTWFAAANKQEMFSNVLEWRLILARDKRGASGVLELDGAFGYAVKDIFVDGADEAHSLRNTGSARFNTWA